MRIKLVEIQNFRKLKSIRIDFNEETTLLVGANNSGKTSAMSALGHFLYDHRRFTTNDFTLSHWTTINDVGVSWEVKALEADPPLPAIADWESVLPTLDLWLEVSTSEIHYVSHLLPTLDWTGGMLGVRLRYEPEKIEELYKEYLVATNAAKETKLAGMSLTKGAVRKVALWPQNMREFLERRIKSHFVVKAYLLDPASLKAQLKGSAQPQSLPVDCEPLIGAPLKGLIRIDEIAAHRGLGGSSSGTESDDRMVRSQRPLSEQLRRYYARHLDPSEYPDASDLDALEAIEKAQTAFDDRLEFGFADALQELATLNYPGVTDPVLKIATLMRPTDGLNHNAAVQYEVSPNPDKKAGKSLRLPEEYNGLGYQNLISMVFRLMSFRDAWMRVGKAARMMQSESSDSYFSPPLHLVLIEEPEAHLHVQVQQVFVRKAYKVLRNHKDLGDNSQLSTQLVVSTHSGHVAHEMPYSCRVFVIMDDSESRGFLFSYEKLFGVKEKSATDLKNEKSGAETGIDRTRRLFYVTCSRTEESLAICDSPVLSDSGRGPENGS